MNITEEFLRKLEAWQKEKPGRSVKMELETSTYHFGWRIWIYDMTLMQGTSLKSTEDMNADWTQVILAGKVEYAESQLAAAKKAVDAYGAKS